MIRLLLELRRNQAALYDLQWLGHVRSGCGSIRRIFGLRKLKRNQERSVPLILSL